MFYSTNYLQNAPPDKKLGVHSSLLLHRAFSIYYIIWEYYMCRFTLKQILIKATLFSKIVPALIKREFSCIKTSFGTIKQKTILSSSYYAQ